MMQENLRKIEMFFDYDMKVKQLMYKISFQEEYRYSQDALTQYVNRIFKALEEIEYYLYRIIDTYKPTIWPNVSALLRTTKNEFIEASLNVDKLQKIYQSRISDMRPEFVESVNNNVAGYYLFSGSNVLPPTSINEYLHLIHASITNCEEIYQSMPKIDLGIETNVYLYGHSNSISTLTAKALLSTPLSSDRIDILSLQDRTLIMARDLGHALMVEIQYNNDKAFIQYFIPKVCNYMMINELPGITTVTKENKFAKGQFEVSIDLLPQQLSSLFSKIPTDADMFKEGGLYCEVQKAK